MRARNHKYCNANEKPVWMSECAEGRNDREPGHTKSDTKRHTGQRRRRRKKVEPRETRRRGPVTVPQPSVRRQTWCEEEHAARSPLTTSQLAHTPLMHLPRQDTHTPRPHSSTHAPGPPQSPGSSPGPRGTHTAASRRDRRRHPKFIFPRFHCTGTT